MISETIINENRISSLAGAVWTALRRSCFTRAGLGLLKGIEMKTTKNQAVEYVARVGVNVARNSIHYRTAGICHCGTCFCCEVVKAVKGAEKQIKASSPKCEKFNPLVNGGDYRGTICCTCGEAESAHK